MALQNKRLKALIEFAQQSALLKANPVADVNKHDLFHEHEFNMLGLPGVHLDIDDGEDEIWLRVDRLQETSPPKPESILLATWLDLPTAPNKEPVLHTHRDSTTLLTQGGLATTLADPAGNSKTSTAVASIALADFEHNAQVHSLFKAYMETSWIPWAAVEKKRRQVISLYAKLFTLKQQLEGGIVDSQLELVWGSGVMVWNMAGTQVVYPLLTRLVEISLNSTTMALELRPRDMDPMLETAIYSAADNAGVPAVEATAKEFFALSTTTFSPFDTSTFEPLLHAAATHLDSKGQYRAIRSNADTKGLPKATTELQVTDSWVLFARPRSASLFIQDLERFKQQLDAEGPPIELPPALAALVTDPATVNDTVTFPEYRGISMIGSTGASTSGSGAAPQDLYFPMPFNEDQVRIAQMLDGSYGVVVQGPPGTGKTHTIANIICHYLALGKKVLVTSMRDPALAVLQEKLPEDIRPLAISLLTSEQQGMKQFEFAVSKIAAEVQRIDKVRLTREISQLAGTIDAYHGKMASLDAQIGDWAARNLSSVTIDGETLEPQEAAEQVVAGEVATHWILDAISAGNEFRPRFTDADITQLRDARRKLGDDLAYLGACVPNPAAFPDSRDLLRAHQDLSRLVELQSQLDSGSMPHLADASRETAEVAQRLSAALSNLTLARQAIADAGIPWAIAMRNRLRIGSTDALLSLLEALGTELTTTLATRTAFLEKPVTVPAGIDLDGGLTEAIANLAQSKSPFGISGLFGKADAKKAIGSILVMGQPPTTAESWQHVSAYLAHLLNLRGLVTRWNGLAVELGLTVFPDNDPNHALAAATQFSWYQQIQNAVALETTVAQLARSVLPSWPPVSAIATDPDTLVAAEAILFHHLTKDRLSATWAVKEQFQQVLSGCNGEITAWIHQFLDTQLGNQAITDAGMQSAWTHLMEELLRIRSKATLLTTVAEVTEQIGLSGAPRLAEALRSHQVHTDTDQLLPDNWSASWRLKRLATYLDSIDGRAELKRLAIQRSEVETGLSRAYQEVVTKRTWLMLAQNANPDVRSALVAYISAIAKIGKGTGKRAVRYRQDARNAAARANPAIPCWIMPHYRVSESLPAEFGCFDLVVIDEASQSDLTALPAILRAKKILVVGDDKQVSPEGVGLDEDKVRSLMGRFLADQVETYRPQMTPERSMYDLFRVVFAQSSVMLKEHFRCVAPIIEYSKREFYNHELRPLRLPKLSERLNPPLIDVFIEDGYRKGDINTGEARYIVDEIKRIVADPAMRSRSIGVVSLLADKQALAVWNMLELELGMDVIQRHQITCGDARTFQGKERDIMFLSLVVSKGNAAAVSRDTFAQRFNVAASRARDRMYLVRSVNVDDLSEADKLRRGLLSHFTTPFANDEKRVTDLRELCESPFECEMYDMLTERGYRVIPQVPVGGFRLDMVVEGGNDSRLAIECDGDRYHGPDRWADDMQRQRTLERAGWRFWRCFASTFYRHKQAVMDELVAYLTERGITPIGAAGVEHCSQVERRRYAMLPIDSPQAEAIS